MADTDEELRPAIAAYLRAWDSWAEDKGSESFIRELGEEGFEQLVDMWVSEKGFVEMFRRLHDELGRYPTFEELHPPGSPFVGRHPAGAKSHGR